MGNEAVEVKQIDWFDDHFYKITYLNEAKNEVTDYLPSVTTKLGALAKPFLLQWYGDLGTREAKERMAEKGDRGSRCHWAWQALTTGGAVIYNPPRTPLYTKDEIDEIIEAHDKNYFIINNQDEMWQLMKLKAFLEEINPVQILSEHIVYDVEARVAGMADNFIWVEEGEYNIAGATPMKLEKGCYVFDLKTGTSVGKEAHMQISCYAYLAEKMGIAKIKGALIGHTSAKTKKGIEGFNTIHLNREQLKDNYSDYCDIAKVWERNFGSRKPKIRQIPGLITGRGFGSVKGSLPNRVQHIPSDQQDEEATKIG